MQKSRVALSAVFFLLGGCGLIDALDKAKEGGFNLQLPAQKYTVSTTDQRWRQPPPGGIPPIPCGAGNPMTTCCTAPIDCKATPLSCEQEMCALKFDYVEAKTIDLASDGQLGQYKGMTPSQILLKQLDIDIDNRLNVSTPPITVYIAPSGVTTIDPMAPPQKLGMIPTQGPRSHGMVQVSLDDAAQKAFSAFATDFQTPFNLIFSTSVLLRSGDPAPDGMVVYTIGGTIQAKF
jgi:uncharacterized protein YceK